MSFIEFQRSAGTLRTVTKSVALTALARKMNTRTSAVSRIESHAQDIRLSTLDKYVSALGRKLQVSVEQ